MVDYSGQSPFGGVWLVAEFHAARVRRFVVTELFAGQLRYAVVVVPAVAEPIYVPPSPVVPLGFPELYRWMLDLLDSGPVDEFMK